MQSQQYVDLWNLTACFKSKALNLNKDYFIMLPYVNHEDKTEQKQIRLQVSLWYPKVRNDKESSIDFASRDTQASDLRNIVSLLWRPKVRRLTIAQPMQEEHNVWASDIFCWGEYGDSYCEKEA